MIIKKGEVVVNNLSVGLDHAKKCNDFVFISHPHYDHLVHTASRVICSEATRDLACKRGKQFLNAVTSDFSENDCNFELLNSGHVLGSKSLFINNGESLLYTSDFCPRDRYFLVGFKPKKCDYLVIESSAILISFSRKQRMFFLKRGK